MAEMYPLDVVPDRPEFAVRIDGEELEPVVRADIVEIDVYEHVDRHGRATLLVQNWDTASLAVRHSDDAPFVPGAEVEIDLGYHSTLDPVFSGVITALRAHFPAERAPTLEVECRSRSILLDAVRRSRVVEDSSDTELADTIAGEHGLTLDGADGIEQPVIVQHDETDWAFLTRRGADLGWVTYVRGTDLVWKSPAAADQPVTLTYTQNIIELELSEDLARHSSGVAATGWNSADLEVVESESTPSDAEVGSDARAATGDALDDAGFTSRDTVRPTSLQLETTELDRRSVGVVTSESERHYWGRARTIGLPALRCDQWIVIDGVGTRLAGAHWIAGVRHRLGAAGFHTELQLGRQEPLLPPPISAGHVGGGLMIGVVEDLEDPESWGRVKVGFPWRRDAPEATWARVATLSAGEALGTLFVPDVGEEVVVGHVGGDQRFPVVLGSLWNGQHPPPDDLVTDGNDHRGIVTRSGHRLIFADGDSTAVTLTTAGGHVAAFDDEAGSITLTEAAGQNVVEITDGGIVLTAGSGDIELVASGGSVKVDALEFEIKGSSGGAVTSSGNLDLKGSGIVDMSGALVKINS